MKVVKYRRSSYDGGWSGPDWRAVNFLNNTFNWSVFRR